MLAVICLLPSQADPRMSQSREDFEPVAAGCSSKPMYSIQHPQPTKGQERKPGTSLANVPNPLTD